MVGSSSLVVRKEGKEITNVQLISNDVCKPPTIHTIQEISYQRDPSSALSMIPPKVIIVQDLSKCYKCKVGGIGDMKIRQAYDKLCENGIQNKEFKIFERKGLTRALNFPTMFKT